MVSTSVTYASLEQKQEHPHHDHPFPFVVNDMNISVVLRAYFVFQNSRQHHRF